jgi:hypothetical protein
MPRVTRHLSAITLLLLSVLVAAPAGAALILNEVDYDQAGADNAEFIELLNTGPGAVDLSLYQIELVNGSGGGAVLYGTLALPAIMLPAGAYYVVCGDPANAVNCDLDVSPNSDLIQNGSPDAIGLRLVGGALVDAFSYEGNTGAPYTETAGTVTASSDNNTDVALGMSRFPDGTDTDNNAADWSLRCITPHQANSPSAAPCQSPVSTQKSTWGTIKMLYR